METIITRNLFIAIVVGTLLMLGQPELAAEGVKPWTFVSIPDFLNEDIDFPEPRWDDALAFTLNAIKSESPDFVLVAGDMVNGRWWRSQAQLDYMADRYYSAWNRRMAHHGLNRYYVAIGDHEIGDNPWAPKGGPMKRQEWNGTWDCAPLEFVPLFKKAFQRNFDMPRNGPSDELEMAYFVRHKNVLLVTLDVFDQALLAEHGQADVTQTQLDWLDKVLTENADVPFKIVQGHTPILGPVRKKNSSGMMLKDGQQSALWKILVKHGIDLYLCGEVHAITCIERDGIQQIAHGSIFGWNEKVNYLVGQVSEDEIKLTLKEIDVEYDGTFLPQSAANEPREIARISKKMKSRGFESVGQMTLRVESNHSSTIDKSGYFLEMDNPP